MAVASGLKHRTSDFPVHSSPLLVHSVLSDFTTHNSHETGCEKGEVRIEEVQELEEAIQEVLEAFTQRCQERNEISQYCGL